MSYELKMQGVGNGKRPRLYKKTKRASMDKIDAIHLPMRVQSDKGLSMVLSMQLLYGNLLLIRIEV